jgi:hypothetical protein
MCSIVNLWWGYYAKAFFFSFFFSPREHAKHNMGEGLVVFFLLVVGVTCTWGVKRIITKQCLALSC